MKARVVVLAAIAAVVTVTSVAAAGPNSARQRVVLTSKGFAVSIPPARGQFVFLPLETGRLEPDSGKDSSLFKMSEGMRGGQRTQIETGVTTSTGKLGTFVIRYRIEWVDAGGDYKSGAGTWTFVRGTGQYAGLSGGGRSGNVFLGRGRLPFYTSSQGFLKRS
jgi:hypothetical protein